MIRAVPKPKRVRDPAYLRWLRGLPCCACAYLGFVQQSRTEAHHVKTRGSGGGDDTAICICKWHHQQFHLLGRKTFGARYNLDLVKLAQQLYRDFQQHGWAA